MHHHAIATTTKKITKNNGTVQYIPIFVSIQPHLRSNLK
jgi:hypothetical protein